VLLRVLPDHMHGMSRLCPSAAKASWLAHAPTMRAHPLTASLCPWQVLEGLLTEAYPAVQNAVRGPGSPTDMTNLRVSCCVSINTKCRGMS
jgi:hypothetical protein